ncbi:MAG: hypothetical protein WC679_09170 [Bacteroidales bacterium]
MQQIKISIVSILFILGLLVSPTVSFEDRVDVALKFESGLLVKQEIAKGIFSPIITTQKTNSRTTLDLILSEHRFGVSKVNSSPSAQECNSYANNKISPKHIYYLNHINRHYSLNKTIYQLRSLLI